MHSLFHFIRLIILLLLQHENDFRFSFAICYGILNCNHLTLFVTHLNCSAGGDILISLKIVDVKGFMAKLLFENASTFDSFLVSEILITTYNTFHINGHINQTFYSSATSENDTDDDTALLFPTMSSWKTLKPICFDLIKGKRTPLNFKFTFQFSAKDTDAFLLKSTAEISSQFTADTINGLILNIRYDDNALTCITSTSLNIFTMDKSLEQAWDNTIRNFFTANEIEFKEN